jgi:type II secretory pathway pseudopilin PulG
MPTGSRRGCGGFAYVLLLIAVALIGVVTSSALALGASLARRDAERQLLAIGAEFQQALYSYSGVAPGAAALPSQRGPRSLDELLLDPRMPGIRRHLRQVYADPLTGRAEWGLVRDGQGFIVGIHSLAPGRPLKRTGFEPRLAHLEEAESYAVWVFSLAANVPPPGTVKPVTPSL